MGYILSIHNIMKKGKPYSEIVVMIVKFLKKSGNNLFSKDNFPEVDPINWRRVVNKLVAEGYITRKDWKDNTYKVRIYEDNGLITAFDKWSEKYDWREYLY